MPTFDLEKSLPKPIIGLDEVGRGPLAGPVVSCAFIFFDYNIPLEKLLLINDSKKLTKQKRLDAYKIILNLKKNNKINFSLGHANVIEIDKFNILEATKLSMKRACDKLRYNKGTIIIDGNINLEIKNFLSKSFVKGDQKSFSIAAASIIAKIYRDRYMSIIGKNFMTYEWHKNSGYGTKKHLMQIYKNGITIHHRKTFKPMKELIHSYDSNC